MFTLWRFFSSNISLHNEICSKFGILHLFKKISWKNAWKITQLFNEYCTRHSFYRTNCKFAADLDIDIILVFLKRVHQLECLKIAKNFKIQKKTCPISIEFINVNGLMTYFLWPFLKICDWVIYHYKKCIYIQFSDKNILQT